MNKNLLQGFHEIKAEEQLIAQTKKKMLQSLQKRKHSVSVRKIAFAAVPVMIAAVVLTMLFSNFAGGNRFITVNAQDLMEEIKPQNVNVSNAITEDFTKSTQNFSISLFKQIYTSGENTLVSPASAVFALGMTANGAAGDTQKEFTNVLGKYHMTIDDLNKAYKSYIDLLTEKSGSTSLNISNSIWFRNNFNANKTFLQNNANYFGAGASALDFNDKSAVDVINNWVKTNTNGKIKKMVDQISNNTVMYLINALSFDAKWLMPFDTEGVAYDDIFHLQDGGKATASFMTMREDLDYIQGENETAILLPYDDGKFEFLCILPNENIKLCDYVNEMSENTIPDLINRKCKADVSVTLPKFKVDADYELNDTLKNMGLNTAFADGRADFSKMSEDGNELYISCVRQKTFLQVDEQGTQAGAATSVEILEGANVNLPSKVINVNRPFVYAIIDTQTNLPLFLGTMGNPKK